MLSEELGKIKKNSEHLENNREILYRDLIERQGNNNPCGTNSRIIIAHSALEMNMIYLIRENNKVMIGYKECLDVLIKAIGNF